MAPGGVAGLAGWVRAAGWGVPLDGTGAVSPASRVASRSLARRPAAALDPAPQPRRRRQGGSAGRAEEQALPTSAAHPSQLGSGRLSGQESAGCHRGFGVGKVSIELHVKEAENGDPADQCRVGRARPVGVRLRPGRGDRGGVQTSAVPGSSRGGRLDRVVAAAGGGGL